MNSSDRNQWNIRPITPADDATVAAIIRSVMPEFGAQGPGFAINDPEVDAMAAAYSEARQRYWVIECDGAVQGGGGIAPLAGAETDTCELRKMYFRPALRGRGAAQALIELALQTARELGFRRCYLETLSGMDAAQALYRRNGFNALCAPLGRTGHFGCDRWFAREL